MRFFDFFKKKETPVALEKVQTLVVNIPTTFVNNRSLSAYNFRMHMWVVTKSGDLGIITACGADNIATVVLVKDDGTNRMTLQDNKAVPITVLIELEDLRQAYLDEVPACRHPDVDHESHMRSHGYIHSREAV